MQADWVVKAVMIGLALASLATWTVLVAKSIDRSAGYPLLDEETLALIHRAQPLPEPPAEMRGEQLEFVEPVEFFLNREQRSIHTRPRQARLPGNHMHRSIGRILHPVL